MPILVIRGSARLSLAVGWGNFIDCTNGSAVSLPKPTYENRSLHCPSHNSGPRSRGERGMAGAPENHPDRGVPQFVILSRFFPLRIGILSHVRHATLGLITARIRQPMNLRSVVVLAIALTTAAGCGTSWQKTKIRPETDAAQLLVNRIRYDVSSSIETSTSEEVPFTVYDETTEYWDLSPEEAVRIALSNATVLRDLGGMLIGVPESVSTVFDPVLRETDPRFGVEAALSKFDAQLRTFSSFEKNDRAVNNRFLGGGANLVQQDLFNHRVELTKRAATGTSYTLRNQLEYDANNLPGNLFPSAWTAQLEAEVRHPLMRGGGTGFNRIAGPGAVPGNVNGVVIARLNSDISVIELELRIRGLVNDIENAYWDLHYAYRLLDTRKAARDRTLQILKRVQARGANLPGGVAEQLALTEAQYFAMEIEVQNALGGRLIEGTQSNNGSRGGTFRGTLGIHVADRRLRLLMGVPVNDGRLIRPTVDPVLARVLFDWDEIVIEAMRRRSELRKQNLEIRRRELELVAAKNFLLPQLDLLGRHRFRGFGNDLIDYNGQGGVVVPPLSAPRFGNAIEDLMTGDFQEWMVGVEMTLPIGFREGYNAVRNAHLRLARDRAVLAESQRVIRHDLSNAISDLHRAHEVCRAAYHRQQAVKTRRQLLEERDQRTGNIDVAILLDVYRQESEADAEYVRSLVDHAIAIKNIHFEKGSVLEYSSVYLDDRG